MKRVFVDGAAGTVGSALHPYLVQLQAEGILETLAIDAAWRKDESARKDAMRQADLVVLCLPDAESASAVALVQAANPDARILDAGAAHRCHPDWVYGLPEVTASAAIAAAHRVANPGCFATACILAGRPLVQTFGVQHLEFQGLTGYSAGGRKIRAVEMPRLVQFGKPHRHLPEIAQYTGALPTLTVTVGPWRRGMLVQTYLPHAEDQLLRAYQAAYERYPEIRFARAEELEYRIDPQGCNESNRVLICVASQPNGGTCVAVVLDNLGKGSAGAAADNLRLMLQADTV